MSDDWQVGDLALCVDDGPDKCDGRECDPAYLHGLRIGRVFTVTHVVFCKKTGALGICNVNEVIGGHALRFRKIRPLSEEEKREAMRELEGEKPAKVPA